MISLVLPFTVVVTENAIATPFLKIDGRSSSPSGYSPAQIQSAYGVDAFLKSGYYGNCTTIVIIDAYGSSSISKDVNYFDSYFKLTAITLNIFYPGG